MIRPARDPSSFATRAILGEESWTRDPTAEPMVMLLSGMASASLGGAMVASYQHRRTGAVAGTGLFLAITLVSRRGTRVVRHVRSATCRFRPCS